MRAFASILVLLTACSAEPAVDGGMRDAGTDAAALDAGGADAGSPVDAGRDAGEARDAGSGDDAGAVDSGGTDASSQACNAGAVRFEYLASGPLEEGVLCDEVFVCADNAGEEARVTAASSAFTCTGEAHSLCGSARACFYAGGGPGVIDAAELAEICAVTLLTPTPDVVCVVYGP